MVYEFSKAFEKMTYFIQFDLNSGVFSVFWRMANHNSNNADLLIDVTNCSFFTNKKNAPYLYVSV